MIKAFKNLNPNIIILYHSCGDFRPIIADLIDVGVEFLNTMQRVATMDPYGIKKEFGHKVAFKGGLDTQQLMPNGTPAEVREGVKEILKAYAPGGGYVFMPAHLLYQDVPIDNIWAMLEAVRDYGRYPLKLQGNVINMPFPVKKHRPEISPESIVERLEPEEALPPRAGRPIHREQQI